MSSQGIGVFEGRLMAQDDRTEYASRLRVCEACVRPSLDLRMGKSVKPLGEPCKRCGVATVDGVMVRGDTLVVANPRAAMRTGGGRPRREREVPEER